MIKTTIISIPRRANHYNQILRDGDTENHLHAQRRVLANECLGTKVPKHLSVYPFKWDADMTITDDVTREGVVGTIRVCDVENLSGKRNTKKALRDEISLVLVTKSTSPYLYLNVNKMELWIRSHFSDVTSTSILLRECNRILNNTNRSFYDLLPSTKSDINLAPQHLIFVYGWLLMERSVIIIAKNISRIHSSMSKMRDMIFPFRWVYVTYFSLEHFVS